MQTLVDNRILIKSILVHIYKHKCALVLHNAHFNPKDLGPDRVSSRVNRKEGGKETDLEKIKKRGEEKGKGKGRKRERWEGG